MSCPIAVENVFGPAVNQQCLGGFDFTLLFEESILSIPVSAIGILLILAQFAFLRWGKPKTNGVVYLGFKIFGWALLSGLNIALLKLWAAGDSPTTNITVATAALTLVCTIMGCVLTFHEHYNSVKPSRVLQLYLLMSIICDIPRSRTLWYIQDGSYAVSVLFVTNIAVRVPLMLLESVSKRHFIKPEYADTPLETMAGIFGEHFFLWINVQLMIGYRTLLTVKDLIRQDSKLSEVEFRDGGLQRRWAGLTKKYKDNALLVAFILHYKWAIAAGVIPRLLQLGFTLAQPFLVEETTYLLGQPVTPESTNAGYGLIASYGLCYIGVAVFTAAAQHQTYRVITMLRGSLVGMIYNKTIELSSTADTENSAVTLMSADIERVASGLRYLHDLWGCTAQIPIVLWLLWIQLGVAALGPIIVAVTVMIIAVGLSAIAGGRQKLWLEAIETRVDATAKMLGSMKGIKLLGMTDKAFNDVRELKEIEIKQSEKFRQLLIGAAALGFSNTALAPVISFAIYSIRAQVNGTTPLQTTQAMTSMALFGLVSNPMTSLVEALAGAGTFVGSLKRIDTFLMQDSRSDDRISPNPSSKDDKEKPSDLQVTEKHVSVATDEKISQSSTDTSSSFHCRGHGAIIVCKDKNAGWGGDRPPVLHNLSFEIYPSTLTIVVGPVGCGKSTFLYSLLGETPEQEGYLSISTPNVAFCSQTPWLTNKTLRDNILGESPYDEEVYKRTIKACALEPDIAILTLGDQTMLGSQGAVLSGGQKQRISLARAVYSQKPTVILDDVLSGLDNTTEAKVVKNVFGPNGIFRERGTTVILATNSVHQLPLSDHIIALGVDGTIIQQGSWAELNATPGFVQSLLVEEKKPEKEEESDQKTSRKKSVAAELPEMDPEATRTESDFSVYKYYMQAIGYWRFFIFIVFLAILVFFSVFPSVWIAIWTGDAGNKLGLYLGIFFLLGFGATLFILLAAWHLMANMVSKAARVIHTRLLTTVLNAPMSFFSTTDLGVTTNRFTQDLQLIDMELPLALLNTCLTALTIVGQLVVISATTRYLAATIPFLFATFFLIQRFYLRSARQIRIIDIEAKSPLFSHFLETQNGLVAIRAYGWVNSYKEKGRALLEESQKPFYLLYSVQRWLEVVIGLTVAGLSVLLVGVAFATRGMIGAGFIGSALVQLVSFSEVIQGLIIHWTVLETSIGAVARIKSFTAETANENLEGEDQDPPPDWPGSGRIEFEGVSASYKKGQPVLKNVSVSINPGERVAIVGRTGSGKSTLISTLFRTLELDTGTILVDDIDITTLVRQQVRSKMIVIPQEPYLIRGTVRFNVDPSKTLSDDVIIKSLQKVQLWDTISKQGGLDANVTQDLLSHGQRQLLCLSSAILRKGKIVVLDEATSSVDQQTDELMQKVIRAEFPTHTIIAVAHRLDTILDFDRVIFMEAGIIAEMGNPQELLKEPPSGELPSRFRQLFLDSSHASKLDKKSGDGSEPVDTETDSPGEPETLDLSLENQVLFNEAILRSSPEVGGTGKANEINFTVAQSIGDIFSNGRRPSQASRRASQTSLSRKLSETPKQHPKEPTVLEQHEPKIVEHQEPKVTESQQPKVVEAVQPQKPTVAGTQIIPSPAVAPGPIEPKEPKPVAEKQISDTTAQRRTFRDSVTLSDMFSSTLGEMAQIPQAPVTQTVTYSSGESSKAGSDKGRNNSASDKGAGDEEERHHIHIEEPERPRNTQGGQGSLEDMFSSALENISPSITGSNGSASASVAGNGKGKGVDRS